MEFDFHPEMWSSFFTSHPVVLVVILGLICGMTLTQLIKKTWLAFGDTTVISEKRYTVGCMWLAVLVTMLCTRFMWEAIVGITAHGLRHVICAVTGILSLPAYWALKTLVIHKWPALQPMFGEHDAKFKT